MLPATGYVAASLDAGPESARYFAHRHASRSQTTGYGRIVATVAALLLGAMSVSGAIFLILEMNRPYTGMMQISIEPIRFVMSRMGH